jgi:hypothetical protein
VYSKVKAYKSMKYTVSDHGGGSSLVCYITKPVGHLIAYSIAEIMWRIYHICLSVPPISHFQDIDVGFLYI